MAPGMWRCLELFEPLRYKAVADGLNQFETNEERKKELWLRWGSTYKEFKELRALPCSYTHLTLATTSSV